MATKVNQKKAKAKKKSNTINKKQTPNHKERISANGMKPEHIRFVQEYLLNGCIGYRAYKTVFPKSNYDSACAGASRLLSNVKIMQAIKNGCAKIWGEKDAEIEKVGTYQSIKALSISDISEIVDLEDGTLHVKDFKDIPPLARQAIKSVTYMRKDTQMGTDENITVVLHDKMKALDSRAKLQGLLKNEPVEVDIIIKPAVRPKDDEDIKVAVRPKEDEPDSE